MPGVYASDAWIHPFFSGDSTEAAIASLRSQ